MDSDGIVDLDTQLSQFLMQADVKESIERATSEKARYNINLDTLREFNPKLAQYVFKSPEKVIIALEKKLNQLMQEHNDDSMNDKTRAQAASGSEMFPTKEQKANVCFVGSFGRNHITPRGLKAPMLNKLVKVQGIVTRMSIVHPRLVKSYHYVEATKSGFLKNYTDNYSITEDTHHEKGSTLPKTDAAGNRASIEYGYCEYKKMQRLVIQELPERAPPGQLPRSITVILEDELVDRVKPGDRVEVTGIYKTEPGETTSRSGVFRTILYGLGIEKIKMNDKDDKIDAQDIKNIKKLAGRKDLFDVLANSVAPSIYGHHSIKKGILLQLLGGIRRKVAGTGTNIRGDVNILMVGDPSTAKSQLLRQVMEIAPLAINTTGRGSSGVGLTAAVIIDKDSGERHLEAGAMVLADKGIVCIDEFDKMNEADRVALHEVMEQQTVTISKAGIHASLNARCSVIAAANPIYGDYDTSISAARNIGLPDSLLSRFDLLFVVLDDKNPEVNTRVAEKVIMNHRFKRPGEKSHADMNHDDFLVEPEIPEEETTKRKVYENDFENFLAGGKAEDSKTEDVLDRNFLRKYLSYAKATVIPVMNSDAVEFLSSSYSLLRQKGDEPDQIKEKKLPITARTLETLIRLATAHAKLRLSQIVNVYDMKEALKLLNFSIFTHDDNDDIKQLTKEEQKEQVNQDDEEEEIPHTRGASKRIKVDVETKGSSLKANLNEARKARLLGANKENKNTENVANMTRSHFMNSKDQVDYVLNRSIKTAAPVREKLEVTDGEKRFVYKLLTMLKKEHVLADSFTLEDIENFARSRSNSKLVETLNKTHISDVIKELQNENKVMLIEGG